MVRTTFVDRRAVRRRRSRARSTDAFVRSRTTRRSAEARDCEWPIFGAAASALNAAGVSIPEQYRRGLKGSLNSTLEPAGTIARPSVRATLAARDVSAADWPAGTVDAVLVADREGVQVHRLDARSRSRAGQRFRQLRVERTGQRPVRRVRQRHRRAGSQVSSDASRDVRRRAPRRPCGEERSTSREGRRR